MQLHELEAADPTQVDDAHDYPPGWEQIANRLVRLNAHIMFDMRLSQAEHFTFTLHGHRCWTPSVSHVEFKELAFGVNCRMLWDVQGRRLKVAVLSSHPVVRWDISARVFGACTLVEAPGIILRRFMEHHGAHNPLEIDIAALSRDETSETDEPAGAAASEKTRGGEEQQEFSHVLGPVWAPKE